MSEVLQPNFRKIFAEICGGFSKTVYKDKFLYIKHLSHIDYVWFEDIQQKYSQEAKDKGLPTEQEKLEFLIKNNLWAKNKEKDIETAKDFILRLEITKKKQVLPSQVKEYENMIRQEEDKLNTILREKFSLLGMTVETYSQRMVNDYYIIKNIYKDQNCIEPFFDRDDFEELEDEEVEQIIAIYNSITNNFSDENVKKLALQDFFQSYYFLCQDNIKDFFGKPICNLSFYQIKLGNYAKYYKSILENIDSNTIPKETRYDPEKLESFISAKKETEKLLNNSADGQPTSLVGATKQDLESLGLKDQVMQFPNKPMDKDELMRFFNGG